MKNIAFLSFGKDSMAQLIVAHKLGIKIDDVVYCEIRYDEDTSAEHPLMAEWIPKAEKILLDKFGIKVTHIKGKTFKELFYTKKEKGNHIGDNYGFPFVAGSWCNDRLKLGVIDKYKRSIKEPYTEIVGIAYDEPKRYERLIKKPNKRSILYEQKITEAQAFEICKEHDLLSPLYAIQNRGGCWFCIKQNKKCLYQLYKDYPQLWNELKELQKDSKIPFYPKQSIFDLDKEFKKRLDFEKRQIKMF